MTKNKMTTMCNHRDSVSKGCDYFIINIIRHNWQCRICSQQFVQVGKKRKEMTKEDYYNLVFSILEEADLIVEDI